MTGCAQCGFEDAEGRKFCGECGTALAVTCPSCGAANEPGMHFCGECGTGLAETAAPAAAAPAGGEGGAPGRRGRAGVLTGEAAVSLAAVGEGMVAGDLVNTAARIQSAASPGTVLVGDATRRASAAAIAYEPAGEHELKG